MVEFPRQSSAPSGAAKNLVEVLEEEGVTHVVTIPDNTSAPILAALEASSSAFAARPVSAATPVSDGGIHGSGTGSSADSDAALQVVLATREGEAMALAAGLWMGGAFPSVLIQNTGLLEAGDGLRGTLCRMGVPLVLFVTCRGYEKAREAGLDPASGILDRGALLRNDLDSVALMTEPTLRAWGIPFHYLREPSDLSTLHRAFAHAREDGRPVAVLLDASF